MNTGVKKIRSKIFISFYKEANVQRRKNTGIPGSFLSCLSPQLEVSDSCICVTAVHRVENACLLSEVHTQNYWLTLKTCLHVVTLI